MKKQIIKIPSGVKYIGDEKMKELMPDWQGFERGCYNKGVTGCGATTYALKSDPKSVALLVPRIVLLVNKAQQTEDAQMVYGEISTQEIQDYIDTHRSRRMTFLSTWDSAPRLRRLLGDTWDGLHIYVDEYQLFVADSSYRAYVELSFLECIRDSKLITFLSATPCMPEFLERIPFLKDLPFYEFDWADKDKVEIHSIYSKQPINALGQVVQMYQRKEYPTLVDEESKEVIESTTMNAFFSSVNGILSIVKNYGLSPENTTIICSPTDENVKALESMGFKIGEPPQRNKPRTTFLFATSCSYVGADFYSKDACTFVIADCKKKNLSIDISTELVQICGRERLEENKFRKSVVFINNNWQGKKDMTECLEAIKEKYDLSREEMEVFNQEDISEKLRDRFIRQLKKEKRSECDANTYTYWDEVDKRFKLNELSIIADEYETRVQYSIYHDGTYVLRNIEEQNTFTVKDRGCWAVSEQVKNIVVKTTFAEKMEQYCTYRQQTVEENFMASWFAAQLERQNEALQVYYDNLGPERIKALGYKEKNLREALNAKHEDLHVRALLDKAIRKSGCEHKADEWKDIMNRIYQQLGINKKGVVSNLEREYGYRILKHHKTDHMGKRYYSYEVIL